ncbi:LPS biosynthesis protein WbpP [Echinicola strongylocentroti]|uniref:LPS biosynthesis protein WbpP n=1 Tax=Echinicola strongylocentroti TaxID=1795355 RepID=A0A2Z4IGP0_9BACT|nr:SDR family oxidoreductase [Echinicola strongylocentroti]AWW29648.1 LPS biosynthesis protein WbpP [Echinicola strongylocentroti]
MGKEKLTSELSGAKVLVTGGAGFIGSNLIDTLLEAENKVVCLDNFSTGKPENLENAKKSPLFTMLEGDIRDAATCQKAVEGCEVVFHQAALGSVPRSIADPMTTTDVNIGGFVKVLFAAKEAGVKRVVYAASSSTYGDHSTLPKVEHVIGNALSPYAITKYVDELFAKNFADIYGLETIGLRYFNVFGRRQDPDGAYAAVIPKFVQTLIKGQQPKINGDGSFSRDFTYIDNVIQANIKAAVGNTEEIKDKLGDYYAQVAQDFSKEAVLSEVFNVAFGERVSLNQLGEYLKTELSKFEPGIANIAFEYGPQRAGDVPHSLASIDKARGVLGYEPAFSMKEGLEAACDWYWNSFRTANVEMPR